VTDPAPHLFWITSRAAGMLALLLSSLAVCAGLLMSSRLARGRGLDLRAGHEALALATMIAIGVHAVALLGDRYLHPGLADISVPFVSGYKTFWTSTGILAGWATAALGLSYYARARIGQRRWRKLHSLTLVAWLLGLAHSLGEGTDAGRLWFLAMTGIVAVPAAALLLVRLSGAGAGAQVSVRAGP
jgi:sulfoxide reductase heme-binding subunit YedZ